MNRIDDLKDETIKTLARTLKESGLAASETEAIRMANNMSQTNKKANDTFEERREKNTMGLSFLHKEAKQEAQGQKVVEEEVFAEDISSNDHSEEDCISCSGCASQGVVGDKPLNDLFESESRDEFIEQDLIRDDVKEEIKDDQPEATREVTSESKSPKKDINQYKEANVDLGDVFKFKN